MRPRSSRPQGRWPPGGRSWGAGSPGGVRRARGGAELLGHAHLFGRAVILSGGNDWLAYESFARDILLNGPLLTEGRALGQGLPFYYQPLYIYWVALTHLLLGESLFAPLFMNAVLGVATGVGLYLLTRELFGRTAAIVAMPLFEVYRQTVFAPTAGLLLSENLLFPLVPVFLLALARLAVTGRLGRGGRRGPGARAGRARPHDAAGAPAAGAADPGAGLAADQLRQVQARRRWPGDSAGVASWRGWRCSSSSAS